MKSADHIAIVDAAYRGMADAGFANVRAYTWLESDRLYIDVRGDCPCGLGTSGIGLCFPVNVAPRAEHAHMVYRHIHGDAMRHIEVDRAEGRWTS